MAITNQPAEDSLYSAYSQIPVETDKLTPGLEIKTQNFDEDNMVSLNIIDNEAVEVIDNSGGSSNDYSVKFPLRRKVIPGEWYAFRVSSGAGVGATSLTVALFQATSSGNLTTVIAKTNIPIGDNMTWKVQVPQIVTTGSPCDYLVIFAGIEGATAGVKVTLTGMSLAYGQNFVPYSPSPVKAANSLTESIDIYRDSGFGTTKKYDLRFLAKAGFRDDRLRTFPYIDQSIGFAIDYSLISAYAYRGIGERNFKQFLMQYLPAQPGEMVDETGRVIARHDGLMYYTLGQRKGLGIGGRSDGSGESWFVIGKDLKRNLLIVQQGEHDELFSLSLDAEKLNWIAGNPPANEFACTAKFRYRQPDQAVHVTIEGNGAHVRFEYPQRAVTPGQWVVFYQGDVCLGGGPIDRVEPKKAITI